MGLQIVAGPSLPLDKLPCQDSGDKNRPTSQGHHFLSQTSGTDIQLEV